MGAKTWMLVYSNKDVAASLKKNSNIDRNKTVEFLKELFPKEKLDPIEDGCLSYACPEDDIIYAGYFADVFIVSAKEFAIDYPSRLDNNFLKHKWGNTIYLHAMHSVVDWFAFGVWKDGKLERALSLAPDSGILEDTGEKLSFEIPYWNGEYSEESSENQDEMKDPYSFPFHPLELGEVALQNLFGFVIEGYQNEDSNDFDEISFNPDEVILMGFKRSKKSKWKFW